MGMPAYAHPARVLVFDAINLNIQIETVNQMVERIWDEELAAYRTNKSTEACIADALTCALL